MNFQNTLILLLLFLFSAFLFPDMVAAVEAYSGSLQALIVRLPLIWMGVLIVVMGYEIVGGKE